MVTIILYGIMPKDKVRYKCGDYIIRQIECRYYVYKRENVNGETRETHVGSLSDVVESYLKLKRDVGTPTILEGVGGVCPHHSAPAGI